MTSRPSILTALALTFTACEPMPGTTGTGSSTSSSSSSSGSASTSGSGGVSGLRPVNAEKLCSRLINECGQTATVAECRRQFAALLVTEACSDALSAASCAELVASNSNAITTCFPPCNGTLARCNGDGTITICTTSGTTNILDCEAACEADGNRAYSGTCGRSHGAQVSDRDQCFCE